MVRKEMFMQRIAILVMLIFMLIFINSTAPMMPYIAWVALTGIFRMCSLQRNPIRQSRRRSFPDQWNQVAGTLAVIMVLGDTLVVLALFVTRTAPFNPANITVAALEGLTALCYHGQLWRVWMQAK